MLVEFGTWLGAALAIGIGIYALWIYPREIDEKRKAGEVRSATTELTPWVRLSGAVVLFAAFLIVVLTLVGV